jgi:hypothetical protein
MITVPTRDLCGIVADAAPFASTEQEDTARNVVRVEWDGVGLHAMATDGYRVGWSTWDPDDPPPDDEQTSLFSAPGGADDPWHAYIPLDDAKALVAAFKLPAKEGGCPLTVDLRDGLLTVDRARDTGHSALTMTITGQTLTNPPDIRAFLAGNSTVEPIGEIAYTGKLLADFGGKVRQRGPLRLTFTGRLTLVSIGDRFVGAIAQVREGQEG